MTKRLSLLKHLGLVHDDLCRRQSSSTYRLINKTGQEEMSIRYNLSSKPPESMEKGQQHGGQVGPAQETPAPPYPGSPVGYGVQGAAQAGNLAPISEYGNTPGAGMNTPAPQYIVTQQPANVTQVVMSHQHLPGDVPGRMKCPHCQIEILTETRHKPGIMAWWLCIFLGLLLIWPCCLIPLFVPACQDVEHRCSTCKKVIHIHRQTRGYYY
ncbi:hypothetical protein UPYG_G00059560 [Umbra pygmaea]|uniref:LITAF domain-containing protein n=1 Tax=Umbra pygmaea TaxID=75934 RepID=A0ABD0X993_UMBPY